MSRGLIRLVFCCPKHNTTTAAKRDFDQFAIQEKNTIVQKPHQPASIKGKSRSSYNKYRSDSGVVIAKKNLKDDTKRRKSTVRSMSSTDRCPFHFHVRWYPQKMSWFLRYCASTKCENDDFIGNMWEHHNHLPLSCQHIYSSKNQMTPEVIKYIQKCLEINTISSSIKILVQKHCNMNVSEYTIKGIKQKMIQSLLDDCGVSPFGSSADKLISLFENDDKISLIYIKHKSSSGFVTYRKKGRNIYIQ